MKRLVLYIFVLLPITTLFGNAQIVGGVALEYDPATVFTVEAGTTLQFDLVARDTASNVITTWSTVGQNSVLAVHGTVAEADTSTRSWSADPLGFTWLELRLNGNVLPLDSTGEDQGLYYTLPPSAFTQGRATLAFTLTCAGKDITLTITPTFGMLTQKSPPITIVPTAHTNYLVEVTWPKPGMKQVFLLRRYEIVVTPRDRYLNTISGQVATSFTAAFPSEFETGPGGPSIFVGTVYIRGVTNYFLMSSVRRLDANGDARQIIMANKEGDATINGWSDPFEIIDHAPNPFALMEPEDITELWLSNPRDRVTFSWIKSQPQDPYTNIQISRFNPSTRSDIVKYEVTFLDSLNPARSFTYPADSNGLAASLTLTHRDLYDLCHALASGPVEREQTLVWYVTARDYEGYGMQEDPLYATHSAPPNLDPLSRPGYRLIVIAGLMHTELGTLPDHFALEQNFPNPFSRITSIPLDLHYPAYCRLVVYNLLGEEVELLHDGRLDSGIHSFQFNAAGLAPGLYTYRLVVDGAVHARNMLLLR